ncbi:hypothetical protein KKB44_06080 [Candidatus Micrarchaeota archaeon]|nr:hypothetical protein [Candidatus Micrarchaeota archaeon]
MKGYSSTISENCATARIEGVNASYKDLAEVCGRLKNKKTIWALGFLEKASKGEIPILYRTHNKRLGHRRELRGRKGRYPKKAAAVVLKLLKSAIANGKVKGLGDTYTILLASANKKEMYPRIASKGRWARSNLETARVEIVLKGEEIPKGVTITPPKKPKEDKKKKSEEKPKKDEKEPKEKKPEEKKVEEEKQPELLKKDMETHIHKEKDHEKKEMPHQHGEYDKR